MKSVHREVRRDYFVKLDDAMLQEYFEAGQVWTMPEWTIPIIVREWVLREHIDVYGFSEELRLEVVERLGI